MNHLYKVNKENTNHSYMAIGRSTHARTQKLVGTGMLSGAGILSAWAITTGEIGLVVLAVLLLLVGVLLVLQSKRLQ